MSSLSMSTELCKLTYGTSPKEAVNETPPRSLMVTGAPSTTPARQTQSLQEQLLLLNRDRELVDSRPPGPKSYPLRLLRERDSAERTEALQSSGDESAESADPQSAADENSIENSLFANINVEAPITRQLMEAGRSVLSILVYKLSLHARDI